MSTTAPGPIPILRRVVTVLVGVPFFFLAAD